MRPALALLLPVVFAGCLDVSIGPDLSFAIDCPVPAGRDHFPASGEVACVATGPWTRAGDVDWDFGDGARAEGDRVTHRYAGAGSYSLSATLGPRVRTGRIGIPAELLLEGDAPIGGVVGRSTGAYDAVRFDVLPEALRPTIVVDTPGGPSRVGIVLLSPEGTPIGGCSCTTPATYPLTEPLGAGAYELRVWTEVGPGVAPAASTPFEARILVPYTSSFLGPFRIG